METMEISGVGDPIHRVKLIQILKRYLTVEFKEAEAIANSLCNGEIVKLSLVIDVVRGNEFLHELSDLGVALRDYSWHEEANGGGCQMAE